MSFETIIYEAKNNIGYITINRPKALNALNAEVLNELSQAVDIAEKDEAARVVIITGAGGRAFVAGADIAAIDGFALGGGCELALACDIRIASAKSKIGIPEVTLGVFPGFAGTQRLPRLVGTGIAKEMLATARKVPADEAKAIGLVNHVVEENPMAKAEELAVEICKNSMSAIALGKRAMNEGMEMELKKGIEHEAALFAVAFTTEDQREGMTAFLEKRPANFQ